MLRSRPLPASRFPLPASAGRYAYAGREWVARKVVELLGANEVELVHNHHNFAWRETHGDEELIVVRKGATPAFPDQRGFIGVEGTVEVLHTLRPLIVVMAGENEHDPYKD